MTHESDSINKSACQGDDASSNDKLVNSPRKNDGGQMEKNSKKTRSKANKNKKDKVCIKSEPEISLAAAKSLSHTIPFETKVEFYLNIVFLSISPLYTRDPIFLWLLFFAMLSISICKNSVYGMLSTESICCFIILLFTLSKYYVTAKGILPHNSLFDNGGFDE